MDIINIYRAFHPRITFFSSAHGIFTRTDHMLGHKTTLYKFKDQNHIQHILWTQHLKTANQLQRKSRRKPQMCVKIKQHATKKWLDQRRNNRRDQKIHKTSENDNTTYQNFGDEAKALIRGNFVSLQAYLKKKRKVSNKQPNITS